MGKGGGSSAPSQTTAYQTNLPEYAKPYVTNMLEATQKQLFNMDGSQITGFKPYTPYSTDPTQYFAGPSSLQTSVYNEAGRMQSPGQFAPATGLAGVAGMGQLGAGADYVRGITDPSRVGAFMSPYQQQVTDIAKMNAVREAQLAGQQANLGAARQGTYGGARQALMGAEREKNLLANLSNIQAQGSQAAYDKAMQNMQFGANLGLQGLAGAASTAGTLGQLGGAQQQADLARMGFQQQTGAAQQQYQQNIINQAIQDYATAQQYPMMQLGFMSNMLRGLPMQATTTQSYMPTPSLTTQAISGLGTAAGAYKAFGFKAGGKVPKYAGLEGSSVEMGMKAKLEALADTPAGLAQVVQIAQSSPSLEQRKLANEVLLDKEQEKRAAAQAEASIAQDQMPRGLAALPAPSMDTLAAAGGGIVAFADEGQVKEDDEYTKYITTIQNMRAKAGIEGSPVDPKLKAMYEERIAGLPARRESDVGMDMIDFFSRLNRPGPLIKAGTDAAQEALPGIAKRRADLRAEELAAATGLAGLTKDERAELLGISKDALALREKELDREKALEVARIGARDRTTDLDKTTSTILADLIAKGAPDNAATRATARKQAIEITGFAQPKLAATQEDRLTRAYEKIDEKYFLERLQAGDDPDKLAAVDAKIAQEKRDAEKRLRTPAASTPTPADTSSGRFPKPDISKVPNVPEGSSIGAQTDKGWEVKDKNGKVIGHIQK